MSLRVQDAEFEELRMAWEAVSRSEPPSCADYLTFRNAVENFDHERVELQLKKWCLDAKSTVDVLALIDFLENILNKHFGMNVVVEDMRLCIFKGIWYAFYSTVGRFCSSPPDTSFGDLIAAATDVTQVVGKCLSIVMPGIQSSQTENNVCAAVTETWSHLANTVRLNSKLVNSLNWRDVQVCLTQKLVNMWTYTQSDEILHAFLAGQLRFRDSLPTNQQVLKQWSAFQSGKDDFERNFLVCIESLDTERGVEKNLLSTITDFKHILEGFDLQAPAVNKPKKGPGKDKTYGQSEKMNDIPSPAVHKPKKGSRKDKTYVQPEMMNDIQSPAVNEPKQGSRKDKTYGQLEMMNDIQSLRRVLHYLSLTRNFNSYPEDASSCFLHVLLIERVLQVTGESVKNTAGSPNLSAKKRTALEKANVPLETLSTLRNALSHFNCFSVERKQHVEKAISVQSVLWELAKLEVVFAKALHRIEFTLLRELAREQAKIHEEHSTEAQFFVSLQDCQSVAQMEDTIWRRMSDDCARRLHILIQQFGIQAKVCRMETLFSSVISTETSIDQWQELPIATREVAKSTLTEVSEMKDIKELLQDLAVPTENTKTSCGRTTGAAAGEFLEKFIDALAHKYMSREFYANVARELFLGMDFPVSAEDVLGLLRTDGDAEFATDEDRLHASAALRLLDAVLYLKSMSQSATGNPYFNGKHFQTTLDGLSDLVAGAHFQPITDRQVDIICESIGIEDSEAKFVMRTILQDMFESVADDTDLGIYDVVEKVVNSCCSARCMEQVQKTKEDVALKAARLKLTAHIKQLAGKKEGILTEEEFNACKAAVNAALSSNEAGSVKSSYNCGNGRTRESDMKLLKNMVSSFERLCRSVKETKSLEESVKAFKEYLFGIDMSPDEQIAAVASFRSMQQDTLESFVALRIKQLQGLLEKYGIPALVAPTRDAYSTYKCNHYLRAAVEMLLLECLEILHNLYTLPEPQAASNFTLCGPISSAELRNFLAHGNSLLESCDHDICRKILDNAIELVANGECIMALRKLIEDSGVHDFIRSAVKSGKLHTVHVSTVSPLSKRDIQTTIGRLQSNSRWEDIVKKYFKAQNNVPCQTNIGLTLPTKLMAEDALNLMLRNHPKQLSLVIHTNPEVCKHLFRDSWTLLHYAMALKQSAGSAIDILLSAEVDVNAADDTKLTPLHLAVMFNSADGVARLLSSEDIAVDAQNIDGVTALHIAAQQGSSDIVQMLLKRNAKPNIQTHKKWSALHFAVGYGHDSIVELLLRAGENPNVIGEDKWTPLHLATYRNQLGVMKLLLECDADAYASLADDPFHASRSVIHIAASYGCPKAMQLLLDKGVDVELKCPLFRYGLERNPLHFAALHGMEDNVVFLLSHPGVDKDSVDDNRWKAVDYAIAYKHLSLVKQMMERGCSPNPNSIIDVAAQGDMDMLKLLHERGADLNATVGAFHEFTPSLAAALGERLDVLKFLLEAVKPDIDNLMHATCMYGCRSVVQFLIVEKHFPDPSSRFRGKKDTPLHTAAIYGRLALIRYLVDNFSMSIDLEDGEGNTPCMLAARRMMWAVVKFCMKRGADVSGERGGQMARIAAYYQQWTLAQELFDSGASLDMQWMGNEINNNMAVLATAACKGNLGMLEYLIEDKHVEVQALPLKSLMVLLATYAKRSVLHYLTTKGLGLASVHDDSGATGLHHAALAGNEEASAFFLDDAGIPVDQCDAGGCSALHYAIRGMQPDMVRYLLSRNADPAKKSLAGQSPLMLAIEVKSFSITDCLAQCKDLLSEETPDQEGNSFVMLLVRSIGYFLPLDKFSRWLDHPSTDVFQKNLEGETVLHYAAKIANSTDVLLMALNKGRATSNDSTFAEFLNGKDRNGNSPLMLVVTTSQDFAVVKATETLIKYHPDLNVQNRKGQTALHLAIQRQNIELFGALLEPLGRFLMKPDTAAVGIADPRLKDSNGQSPLELARKLENKKCVDWLLNYEHRYKMHVLKSEEEAATAKAAEAAYFASLEMPLFDKLLMRDITFVKLCLEKVKGFKDLKSLRGNLPFHLAAEEGNVQVLECLLAAGSTAGAVNDNGQTALHIAALHGRVAAVDFLVRTVGLECGMLDDEGRGAGHCAASSGKVEVLRYLFENGLADVNFLDSNNETCLQLAAANGHNQAIEFLLTMYGAGAEPLGDVAIINEAIVYDHLSTVELLLNQGALAAVMKAGLNGKKSPFFVAIRSDFWSIAKLLLERATQEELKFFLGTNGPVLLTEAAAACQLDVVRLLVEKAGLDPNAPKEDGRTPLMCSCCLGHVEVVSYLLSKNASPNAFHHNTKVTALHEAAKRGRLEAVRILIDHQADALATDYGHDTPVHTAIKFGKWDVAVFILSRAGLNGKELFEKLSFPQQEELRRHASSRGMSIEFLN